MSVALVVSMAPAAASSSRSAAVAVQVAVETDDSVMPRLLAAAEQEASAIWKNNGIDLVWSDAVLHLGMPVARHDDPPGTRVADPWRLEAGRATVACSDTAGIGIRIWTDTIESLFGAGFHTNPLLRKHEFARALGRIVAHELGHVLLGPPGYHDPDGLMRAILSVGELARPEREPFRLADRSRVRLRDRFERSREMNAAGCVR